MFKRLRAPTGEIAGIISKRPDDTPDRIVRDAILIHSGPNGEVTTLQSSDGDIEFDDARIKAVVEAQNKMTANLALQYGGFDKMPIGANIPVLDQHGDDTSDRIRGRVTGLLRFEKRSVPKVGDNVSVAIAEMTFLGADTVSKVLDGRLYHLSIGVDESTNTLGEVSCVIEPAAPGAMVLKKRLSVREVPYRGKVIRVENVGSKYLAKIYLNNSVIAKVPGAYVDIDQAVTAGKEKVDAQIYLKRKPLMNKKLAKLKELSAELKTMAKKSDEQREVARLAKAKADVTQKFTKLMAEKKMTPAEFKKVDFVKLAKLDKESLESIMHVYDAREETVRSGQQGSTSAAAFSDVGTKSAEDREVSRMKLAARKNLEKSGIKFKKLNDDDADDKKELAAAVSPSVELNSDAENVGMVDDSAAVVQQNEEVMQQIEENATQIARVSSMVDAIMDQLNSDDSPEESPEEAPESDEDQKDLSEEKKEDDKTLESKDDESKQQEQN